MDLEARDALKHHHRLVNALRKGPKKQSDLIKELNVSGTSFFKWIKEGKKYGIYSINSNDQVELCIDNFKIITIKGHTGISIKKEMRESLENVKTNDEFLLVVFILNEKVTDAKEVLLDNFAWNIFNGVNFDEHKECIAVDRDTLKIIHIKNKYLKQETTRRTHNMESSRNIVYYNILDSRFSLIEEECLKDRNYDKYYRVIPMFPNDKELISKLHEL